MHKSILFIILFILISGVVYIFSNQHIKSLQQEITSAKERNNILEQENKSLKEQNKSLSQQADQVALQPISDPQKQEVE